MTGHLFRVRFDSSRCDPRFAFVALRGDRRVRDQVFGQVRGATRPGFNTSLLAGVELPIPPLEVQSSVVHVIEAYQRKLDSIHTLQSKAAADVDALLPSILDRAFKGAL